MKELQKATRTHISNKPQKINESIRSGRSRITAEGDLIQKNNRFWGSFTISAELVSGAWCDYVVQFGNNPSVVPRLFVDAPEFYLDSRKIQDISRDLKEYAYNMREGSEFVELVSDFLNCKNADAAKQGMYSIYKKLKLRYNEGEEETSEGIVFYTYAEIK